MSCSPGPQVRPGKTRPEPAAPSTASRTVCGVRVPSRQAQRVTADAAAALGRPRLTPALAVHWMPSLVKGPAQGAWSSRLRISSERPRRARSGPACRLRAPLPRARHRRSGAPTAGVTCVGSAPSRPWSPRALSRERRSRWSARSGARTNHLGADPAGACKAIWGRRQWRWRSRRWSTVGLGHCLGVSGRWRLTQWWTVGVGHCLDLWERRGRQVGRWRACSAQRSASSSQGDLREPDDHRHLGRRWVRAEPGHLLGT
jgi:hypothetical protein